MQDLRQLSLRNEYRQHTSSNESMLPTEQRSNGLASWPGQLLVELRCLESHNYGYFWQSITGLTVYSTREQDLGRLPIALLLLFDDPENGYVSLTISPLKRLQVTQVSGSPSFITKLQIVLSLCSL